MGNNKKSKLTFLDPTSKITYEVDSNEEIQFFEWLIEAKTLGIVLDYKYQPESFKLTDKMTYIPLFDNKKNKEKHLLAEHVYTADFKIVFDFKYGQKLSKKFKISKENLDQNGNIIVYVDVKGGFMSNGSGRSFSINQKIVYMLHHIYINKVVPKEFFLDLGCPVKLFMTAKTNKPSKVFAGYPTIESIFNA